MKDYEIQWREWTPWMFDSQTTLEQLSKSISHEPKIPLIVHAFENPLSPIYLPGPTTMEVHDAIHSILGRGLLNQDEAFVIGICIGAATNSNNTHRLLFDFVGQSLYPKPYRFSALEMLVFNLAFDLAKSREKGLKNVHLMNYSAFKNLSVKDARDKFGIDENLLKDWYREEKRLVPDTVVSMRLP